MMRERLSSGLRALREALPPSRIMARLLPSLRYLFTTEVHAYAFSIAANAYLSFFPFTLMLLAVCRRWLHWESAYETILEILQLNLPPGSVSVIHSLTVLARGRGRIQLMSVVMLFFTASGVFLPLEVALNKVWGIERNRSFLRNQAVSFCLAVAVGVLALLSILLTTAASELVTFSMSWISTQSITRALSRGIIEVFSVPLTATVYFLIYYFLPNGKIAARRLFPAAVVAGILTAVGKFLYISTLPLFRFREVYGPFALSVTLLFWAFGAALILLFGAHLSAQNGLKRQGEESLDLDGTQPFRSA